MFVISISDNGRKVFPFAYFHIILFDSMTMVTLCMELKHFCTHIAFISVCWQNEERKKIFVPKFVHHFQGCFTRENRRQRTTISWVLFTFSVSLLGERLFAAWFNGNPSAQNRLRQLLSNWLYCAGGHPHKLHWNGHTKANDIRIHGKDEKLLIRIIRK